MNLDLDKSLAEVLSESTEATKKRNPAKNLGGVIACTGIALGIDYFGNNRFDNFLLDLAAGGGLYDGLSSGFGKGVLGLMISITPETLDFIKSAMYYKADILREFLKTESCEDLAYKIMAYGGAYAIGVGAIFLGKYAYANLFTDTARRIFKR